MRPSDDPSCLTPDERLSELARILAGGVLRLQAATALSGQESTRKDSPETWPTCLEVPRKTVLSVHTG